MNNKTVFLMLTLLINSGIVLAFSKCCSYSITNQAPQTLRQVIIGIWDDNQGKFTKVYRDEWNTTQTQVKTFKSETTQPANAAKVIGADGKERLTNFKPERRNLNFIVHPDLSVTYY